MFTYSPHPEGNRFLVNAVSEGAPTSINLITNWEKLVRSRYDNPRGSARCARVRPMEQLDQMIGRAGINCRMRRNTGIA
jgi:hypothetical protein